MRLLAKSPCFLVMQISMVLLVLSACKPYRSNSIFPSGEDWLHWNESAREQYVRAYVEGNTQGFAAGCEQANSLMISSVNGQEIIDANNRCMVHMPFTGEKDTMTLVPLVTTFFTTYREHKELGVSQVLRKLDAGRTVEQVHEDFSSKH